MNITEQEIKFGKYIYIQNEMQILKNRMNNRIFTYNT